MKNINQPLQFHIDNFKNIKINWKISKIRNLLYKIRKSKFPKDEIFLNSINLITINLFNNSEKEKIFFCIAKAVFLNINKKNQLERYIIFATFFQLNLYSEVDKIFIDGIFKVAPKHWYQLLNIIGHIKNKNIFIPLTYGFLSSKSEDLYTEFFTQIKRNIKYFNKKFSFEDIKVVSDFELGMRKAIKKKSYPFIKENNKDNYCNKIDEFKINWKAIILN